MLGSLQTAEVIEWTSILPDIDICFLCRGQLGGSPRSGVLVDNTLAML